MSVVLQPLWPRPLELDALDGPLKIPPVTMTEWLAGREPPHLSTNSGTSLVAFQTWRNFKEAFAPELIGQAFEETSASLGRPIKRSVDPFGGSGTTALASQFLGVHPTTVEVNPYLADLVEAKLSSYNVDDLLKDYLFVMQNFSAVDSQHFPGAPETFVEPGKGGRYLFTRQIAGQLAGLRRAILLLENNTHRLLLRVLLCSIAIEVSNVVVSGKGRRYRRGWEKRTHTADEVLRMFDAAFTQAAYDIRRYRSRSCLEFDLRAQPKTQRLISMA